MKKSKQMLIFTLLGYVVIAPSSIMSCGNQSSIGFTSAVVIVESRTVMKAVKADRVARSHE